MASQRGRKFRSATPAKALLGPAAALCHSRIVNAEITKLLAERQPAVDDLCRRLGVARLDLFGSAAREGWEAGRSDLDFVVRFRPRPRGGLLDAYLALAEGLEGLFGCRVDLVTEKSIRNPCF